MSKQSDDIVFPNTEAIRIWLKDIANYISDKNSEANDLKTKIDRIIKGDKSINRNPASTEQLKTLDRQAHYAREEITELKKCVYKISNMLYSCLCDEHFADAPDTNDGSGVAPISYEEAPEY